jgi:RNA-directed DNA polymerase
LDTHQVNGSKGGAEWDAIDWRVCEDAVRRLRGRIFKAAQDGDWPTVRSLQKMMLRSWSNTLVSVRRVTQHNAGRLTAGVDGEVALTDEARMELARRVHESIGTWKPLPVRRVYVPKAGNTTKRRPLGIPVITDRCHQARTVNALEPEWEARFEPRSYGFRPGRSCQDAIAAVFATCCGKSATRLWIVDCDLEAAFDRIDHDHLMSMLGSFPARGMIRAWLKAGVIEPGRGFAPTEEGTPQGGVISPVLMNVALHGLEAAAGVGYHVRGARAGTSKPNSPVVVRYADDLLACCHTRQQAEQVKADLQRWLAPRGLAFNEDKTRIVHLTEGVDFLGFTIRRFGNKLIIKPSKAAISRVKRRLAQDTRRLRGSNAAAVIAAIAPIVRGWASYYRGVVSATVFSSLDDHLWKLTYKWATWTHPNKPKRWVTARYFGRFNPARADQWVFGHRDSGAYLPKFAWTKIERHQMVKGASSPDDPTLRTYWADRRRRQPPPTDRSTRLLLAKQDGRCTSCGDLLLHAERSPASPQEWEQWHRTTRKAITRSSISIARGGVGTPDDTHLIHASCQRRATGHCTGTAPPHAH